MRDPLLADALDGFVASRGDHSAVLDRLSENVRASAAGGRAAARAHRARLRERTIRGWSVAVAGVFLVGVVGGGAWLLRDGISTDDAAPVRGDSTGGGWSIQQVEAILPPVTVIPNDTPAEPAEATDVSGLRLDPDEVRAAPDSTLVAGPGNDTVNIQPIK